MNLSNLNWAGIVLMTIFCTRILVTLANEQPEKRLGSLIAELIFVLLVLLATGVL